MIRKISIGCFCLVATAIAHAQGSFDFDDLSGLDGEPVMSIDINPIMIAFFRAVLQEADPATADVLNGLRGLSLRVYHGGDNQRTINNFIEDATGELEDSGWQRMMFVDDENSKVRIHTRMTAEEVSGLTLMVYDGAEAFFLNIDGSVSAADLGKVMAALNVHAPDGLGGLTGLPFPMPSSPAPTNPTATD